MWVAPHVTATRPGVSIAGYSSTLARFIAVAWWEITRLLY
jgi:hypothetical protein